MDKMLDKVFVFPCLIYIGEVSKTWADGKLTTHQMFKLDWDKFDTEIQKEFHLSIDETLYKGMPYYKALPGKWEDVIRSFVFSLNTDYLTEIRSCITEANKGWSTSRRFDTAIREICLAPSISYIWVAFRLLADCIFDQEKQLFSRDMEKI